MITMWEVRPIFWDELDVENEREEESKMNYPTLYLLLALRPGSFPLSSFLPHTMTSNLDIDLRVHGTYLCPGGADCPHGYNRSSTHYCCSLPGPSLGPLTLALSWMYSHWISRCFRAQTSNCDPVACPNSALTL